MATARSQSVLKVLPSMTDFAFLMPLALLFGRMGGVRALLSDADTGWHIRTGEWILNHHRVPVADFFSFTKAGEAWYAWEWLSDVLFAWLNAHGGLASVVLASILLLAATFTVLFRLARRHANPILALLVTTAAAIISSVHWLARPHLFTLLFLALFYGALERVREGRNSFHGVPYLVLLPAATMLWTNLHGGFFVGIVMAAIYAAGEFLRIALAADRGVLQAERRRMLHYLMTAAACLAASLVNPYFYRLHLHMLAYLGDSYAAQHIAEFLSLSFHHPVALIFELLLLAGSGAAFWNAARGRYTEALLVLVWAHAALLASRNLALYGVVAAPIIAAALDVWLRRLPGLQVAGWLKRGSARFLEIAAGAAQTDGAPRWHLVSVAAMVAVAALLYAPAPARAFRSEYDPAFYPAGAVAVLRDEPAARIFTDDEWGDYLIYRLYPRTRVFVDGRSDFYGARFEQQYLDVLNVKTGWENTLSRFGINTILLSPSAPLAGALKESSRWRVTYDDGVALIFRAGDSISAAIPGAGTGRGRETTKTGPRDPAISGPPSKT